MTDIKKRGRIAASRNVCVIPEFLEQPDVERLARVLFAIAQKRAKQADHRKEDVMT
ncbi:MAG: hypothetical protein FWE74_05860 [Oscillospiraceae bacterium]|nr:hypothetical protein [Oscillospiraceae bacterium]